VNIEIHAVPFEGGLLDGGLLFARKSVRLLARGGVHVLNIYLVSLGLLAELTSEELVLSPSTHVLQELYLDLVALGTCRAAQRWFLYGIRRIPTLIKLLSEFYCASVASTESLRSQNLEFLFCIFVTLPFRDKSSSLA